MEEGSGGRRERRGAAAWVAVLTWLLAAGVAAGQDVGLELGSRPDPVSVEDLDGNAVALSQFIGRKPVLVQFWATWCPVCSELDPKFAAVRRQHGDALEIVVVAVGVNQRPAAIRRHIERHPLPGRLVYDRRGAATRAFRAPTTGYVVALDAAGRVVYTGVGADQDIGAAAARALGR
jgi:thiol-disulfide isomerase/thioredoxin